MKTTTHKLTYAACALALTAIAGCNEEALRDPVCGDENTFEFNGAEYCVVIEEGFLETECPSDFPSGRSFDDFVICATGDPVPDEAADEARRRGFGIPDEPCSGSGCDELAVCLDACDDCEQPDVASYVGTSPERCSVIEFQCEPGQSTFSNECGCGCVGNAPPLCEEGEVIDAPDGCNTCTCVDGAYLCTQQPCEVTLEACLAGCPDCETQEEANYVGRSPDSCSVIDFECDPSVSSRSFSNECGCGCILLDPVTPCTDGDTRLEECNECVCTDGVWSCDTQDCTDLDTCLAACGDGCPAPEFQLCSVDGESFCNSCEASCYEASISTNREPCECPVLGGEPVPYELITLADGCSTFDLDGSESAVARSTGDLLPWFNCDTGVQPFTFDPAAEVIVRAVFRENPGAAVREVVRSGDGASITINMVAPQYCGGPAPFNQIVYLRIPDVDADTTITVDNCLHTACAEFFP